MTDANTFAKAIGAIVSDRLEDNRGYNLPPGTYQLCALLNPKSGKRMLGSAWWGLVPNRARDTRLMPINARAETAGEKRLFAKAFRYQRCLIPADYWVEWQRGGRSKQPFAIQPAGGGPFFFAGVWSKAAGLSADHDIAGQVTFAILTGPPDSDIAHIHNRQPQALKIEAAREWLSRDETDAGRLHQLLNDGRYDAYESWPISNAVGKPTNDRPDIIERVEL